jgi:hypothetical protein
MRVTKTEKKIAIAKDVLKHIKHFKKITQGEYGCVSMEENLPGDDSAQLHIDKITKNCETCALGACFVSYIRLYNKVKIDDFIIRNDDIAHTIEFDYNDNIFHKLKSIFTQNQLDEIESAFELRDMGDEHHFGDDGYEIDEDRFQDAIQFGYQYSTPSDRLAAIMKNIVKNNGKFVPVVSKSKKLVKS